MVVVSHLFSLYDKKFGRVCLGMSHTLPNLELSISRQPFFAFFLLRSNQFFKYLCGRHITQSIRISHTAGGPLETVYVIHICFTCDTQIIFAGCI